MMAGKTIPIDWEKLETALKAGTQQKKILQKLRISHDTLARRVRKHYNMSYADLAQSLYSEGEMLLEVSQYKKALNNASPGNTQMLIWLGKVRLGQKEPDSMQEAPKNDDLNEIKHQLMILQAENDKLRAQQNQPQAEPELCGGDTSV